jgi:hypothetical protein
VPTTVVADPKPGSILRYLGFTRDGRKLMSSIGARLARRCLGLLGTPLNVYFAGLSVLYMVAIIFQLPSLWRR